MFKNKKTVILLSVLAVIAATSIVVNIGNSDRNQFGKEIPADAQIVSLIEIQKNPQNFNEKMVVMEGTVSGQCASLCEFNFREGNSVIEVHLSGFSVPRFQIGKRVRVLAKVYAGSERVVISATGVKLL